MKKSGRSGLPEPTVLAKQVDVLRFAESRAEELRWIQSAVGGHNGVLAAGAEQRWRDRRRTGAHNRYRIPTRLRQASKLSTSDEFIARCRAHRRRAWLLRGGPSAAAGRVVAAAATAEQPKAIWKDGPVHRLETHLWFAKRATMETVWGWKLPIRLSQVGERAIARSLTSQSLVHDLSYWQAVQLVGATDQLETALLRVFNPDDCAVLSPSTRTQPSQGTVGGMRGVLREGEDVMHAPDAFPRGAICPVMFMWLPSQQAVPSGPNASQSNAAFSAGKLTRLLLWAPAPCYAEVLQSLQDVGCALPLNTAGHTDSSMTDSDRVRLIPLGDKVRRLRVMGPQATRVLQGALRPLQARFRRLSRWLDFAAGRKTGRSKGGPTTGKKQAPTNIKSGSPMLSAEALWSSPAARSLHTPGILPSGTTLVLACADPRERDVDPLHHTLRAVGSTSEGGEVTVDAAAEWAKLYSNRVRAVEQVGSAVGLEPQAVSVDVLHKAWAAHVDDPAFADGATRGRIAAKAAKHKREIPKTDEASVVAKAASDLVSAALNSTGVMDDGKDAVNDDEDMGAAVVLDAAGEVQKALTEGMVAGEGQTVILGPRNTAVRREDLPGYDIGSAKQQQQAAHHRNSARRNLHQQLYPETRHLKTAGQLASALQAFFDQSAHAGATEGYDPAAASDDAIQLLLCGSSDQCASVMAPDQTAVNAHRQSLHRWQEPIFTSKQPPAGTSRDKRKRPEPDATSKSPVNAYPYADTVLPVMVVQRPSSMRGGVGSGWDVILPGGWVMPVWEAMVNQGAQPLGMSELQHVQAMCGQPVWPSGFPDCATGRDALVARGGALRDAWLHRQPHQRVNHRALRVPFPFAPHWHQAAVLAGHSATDGSDDDAAAMAVQMDVVLAHSHEKSIAMLPKHAKVARRRHQPAPDAPVAPVSVTGGTLVGFSSEELPLAMIIDGAAAEDHVMDLDVAEDGDEGPANTCEEGEVTESQVALTAGSATRWDLDEPLRDNTTCVVRGVGYADPFLPTGAGGGTDEMDEQTHLTDSAGSEGAEEEHESDVEVAGEEAEESDALTLLLPCIVRSQANGTLPPMTALYVPTTEDLALWGRGGLLWPGRKETTAQSDEAYAPSRVLLGFVTEGGYHYHLSCGYGAAFVRADAVADLLPASALHTAHAPYQAANAALNRASKSKKQPSYDSSDSDESAAAKATGADIQGLPVPDIFANHTQFVAQCVEAGWLPATGSAIAKPKAGDKTGGRTGRRRRQRTMAKSNSVFAMPASAAEAPLLCLARTPDSQFYRPTILFVRPS